MMVDALEENVMKDILSIGLRKRKIISKKKKTPEVPPSPPNTHSTKKTNSTEFGRWLGWVTSHLAQHKCSGDAPTSAKRSQNIVLGLSYSNVLTLQWAAANSETLRDTVYESFL